MRYAIERRSENGPGGTWGAWEALSGQVFPTVAEAKAVLYTAQTCENGKGDGDQYRMVTVGREGDLYRDAVDFGVSQCPLSPGGEPQTLGGEGEKVDARGYWTAWYAGRQASGALLKEAKRVGVTEDQWEALRAVAAEVAYD